MRIQVNIEQIPDEIAKPRATVRVVPFGLALCGLLVMALHDGSATESTYSERDNEVSGVLRVERHRPLYPGNGRILVTQRFTCLNEVSAIRWIVQAVRPAECLLFSVGLLRHYLSVIDQ